MPDLQTPHMLGTVGMVLGSFSLGMSFSNMLHRRRERMAAKRAQAVAGSASIPTYGWRVVADDTPAGDGSR